MALLNSALKRKLKPEVEIAETSSRSTLYTIYVSSEPVYGCLINDVFEDTTNSLIY